MVGPAAHCQPGVRWKLREAVAADAGVLATIDASASSYPWSESQLAAACENTFSSRGNPPGHDVSGERVLLVESNARAAGFVVYSRVLDEGSIHTIAVHPSCQGQGVARRLMQRVLELLSDDGAHRCLLEVRASNAAARGLYRSLGFQDDGIRKNYYPAAAGREDALLMSMELGQVASMRTPL